MARVSGGLCVLAVTVMGSMLLMILLQTVIAYGESTTVLVPFTSFSIILGPPVTNALVMCGWVVALTMLVFGIVAALRSMFSGR